LRGITPDQVVAYTSAILDAGFDAVEIPLNSPNPLESIRRTCQALPGAHIGAGTVLTVQAVHDVAAAGGRLIVAPNTNTDVITAAISLGLHVWPGVATPTEAFTALAAGATGLKLFPASAVGPDGLRAWKAVLPAGTPVIPVGGIDASTMPQWVAAGAVGAGIGSPLYSAGDSLDRVIDRANTLVAAWKEAA
jgi:2-dehydro-3-deoxyphosphogalactonate aldolase